MAASVAAGKNFTLRGCIRRMQIKGKEDGGGRGGYTIPNVAELVVTVDLSVIVADTWNRS
jgi:hypothetical protein